MAFLLKKNLLVTSVLRWFTLSLVIGILSACSDAGMTDLEEFVAETKQRKNPQVDPIPPFEIVPSYFYEVEGMRDPFEAPVGTKPVVPGPKETDDSLEKDCPSPDPYRVQTELERLPLDALKMVGTLEYSGGLKGLVEERSSGTIHQVQTGDYMGENYGQIISISEEKIEVEELHSDGRGCFIEQVVGIALFEDK